MVKFFGIIPARYQSTRLPGKPLALIGGITMIERVYAQCLKATSLSHLAVATDDERIYNTVVGFGGNAIMTLESHPSGTDRCFEAASKIVTKGRDNAVVINIQGDEPFINPAQIDLLAACFNAPEAEIATLVKKIAKQEELISPNTAKVVLNTHGYAQYFSRAPIPFLRNHNISDWLANQTYYKHIGIYAYRYATLQRLVALPQSALELAEMLEQLRWVENGFAVKTQLTEYEGFAIDTPSDLEIANTMV